MPESLTRIVGKKRKKRAREIVALGMLCALVVVISLAFRVTVPINAGSALVIVSGVSFGPMAGFIVGALSRFILNFYEGQGPWTIWQMACWGMLGLLGGVCFNRKDLEKIHERHFSLIVGPLICILLSCVLAYISFVIYPGGDDSIFGWRLYAFGAVGLLAGVLVQKNRLSVDDITLALFTFFTIFILYGGIMNISAMFSSSILPGGEIGTDTLRALYISGVPYDAAHGGTAALFMFFFGEKIIKKLERIKIKYGFYR